MSHHRWTAGVVVLAAAAAVACAVNPATGKSQIMLVSEGSEISMGLSGAQDVKKSMASLDNPAVQNLVKTTGLRMAKQSERPALPWDFTVLDDPQINAFALPGGPIFVTRGILTHFNSEGELAAVLGHEIGHVTARHSAAQMSRQQLGTLGLLAGSIASDRFAQLAGGLSQGMGLLFLKYGRDDETQADALGFRYAYRDGYDVREMKSVFSMLDRTSGGGGKVPEWASTHPAPANRLVRTQTRIDSLNADLSAARVNRDSYLRLLDGMAFGVDPRQGFFRGALFHHPELAFRLEFPQGWKTENGTSAVSAGEPNGAALVQLGFAAGTPDDAYRAFAAQQGVTIAGPSGARAPIGATRAATFRLVSAEQSLEGLVAFVSYGGRTYQLLGVTKAGGYSQFGTTFERVVGSFRVESDRTILAVQPARLDIVTVPSAMSVEQFHSQYPSTGGLPRFLLVNNLQEGALLKRGQLIKRIVGGVTG